MNPEQIIKIYFLFSVSERKWTNIAERKTSIQWQISPHKPSTIGSPSEKKARLKSLKFFNFLFKIRTLLKNYYEKSYNVQFTKLYSSVYISNDVDVKLTFGRVENHVNRTESLLSSRIEGHAHFQISKSDAKSRVWHHYFRISSRISCKQRSESIVEIDNKQLRLFRDFPRSLRHRHLSVITKAPLAAGRST